MMPKNGQISGKVASARSKSNFGGPAGGSALERNANFADAVVESEFVMGWLFSFVSSDISIILISVIG